MPKAKSKRNKKYSSTKHKCHAQGKRLIQLLMPVPREDKQKLSIHRLISMNQLEDGVVDPSSFMPVGYSIRIAAGVLAMDYPNKVRRPDHEEMLKTLCDGADAVVRVIKRYRSGSTQYQPDIDLVGTALSISDRVLDKAPRYVVLYVMDSLHKGEQSQPSAR